MNKAKLYVLIVALLVIAQVLAACATQPTPTQAPAEATQAPAEAPTAAPAAESANAKPVVVAVWSGPEHDNLVKVAADYSKKTGKQVIV